MRSSWDFLWNSAEYFQKMFNKSSKYSFGSVLTDSYWKFSTSSLIDTFKKFSNKSFGSFLQRFLWNLFRDLSRHFKMKDLESPCNTFLQEKIFIGFFKNFANYFRKSFTDFLGIFSKVFFRSSFRGSSRDSSIKSSFNRHFFIRIIIFLGNPPGISYGLLLKVGKFLSI